MIPGKELITLRHPTYELDADSWEKWRLVYKGGDQFVDEYLRRYSNRETVEDYNFRKELTPCPSFAKTNVQEVKNSIFQRMADTRRVGGPVSYQQAVRGEGFGVDLHGTSMTTFIGTEILDELLTMRRVGVFVDMPPSPGDTLRDSKTITPYLYPYKVEEIYSWSWRRDKVGEYQSLLLHDWVDLIDDETGIIRGQWERTRHAWIAADGFCHVRMYDAEGGQVDVNGNPSDQDIVLPLTYIPFVEFEISESLLADVATHQIALLNLESSDIGYLLKSNFPFYVEQSQNIGASTHLKNLADPDSDGDDPRGGTGLREVGYATGRQYTTDKAPEFIHPSPEPVKASMEKQERLKEDIRRLINLSLSNVKSKMASAESKAMDQSGLESGLSYIGLELERGEQRIAQIWADYERHTGAAPKVTYPKKWSLESDDERRKDAKEMEELRDAVPSKTFQKLMSVKLVDKLVGDELTNEQLEEIVDEIVAAPSITADPDVVFMSLDKGIIDSGTAAEILGFPPDAPEKAKAEHAERLARIAESQSKRNAGAMSGARGVKELAASPAEEAREEKADSRDTSNRESTEEPVRGEGR